MAGRRSTDWGFPRWRGYGSSREAQAVQICDRHGCDEAGRCPAPKSPNSPDRWHFCERHAAEYNQGWDYFEGLDKEETAARQAEEKRDTSGYRESAFHEWAGSGDGSRSRDEMRALDVLECDAHNAFDEVKKAYRRLAKANHPDTNQNDKDAASRFQEIQAAYAVLRSAEERKTWKGV